MSTKQAIVKAASQLFAEKGYAGMTIKLIADEVGITPPAVYAFFKNKEDVFVQIYKEVLGGHFDIAEYYANSLHHQSIQDQLYQMLRSIFEYHINDQQQIKIFMRLLLFPPEVFHMNLKAELIKLEERECDLFSVIFDKGMQTGEVRSGNSLDYAKAMVCMMDGLFWQLQRYDETAFWGQFERVWSHFWEGITAQ